uniref:Uncharacterized protein n=1 Tax=Anguilla anguilla TaxID=7936 RepID=A0A0E9TWW4_ANGAN
MALSSARLRGPGFGTGGPLKASRRIYW